MELYGTLGHTLREEARAIHLTWSLDMTLALESRATFTVASDVGPFGVYRTRDLYTDCLSIYPTQDCLTRMKTISSEVEEIRRIETTDYHQ